MKITRRTSVWRANPKQNIFQRIGGNRHSTIAPKKFCSGSDFIRSYLNGFALMITTQPVSISEFHAWRTSSLRVDHWKLQGAHNGCLYQSIPSVWKSDGEGGAGKFKNVPVLTHRFCSIQVFSWLQFFNRFQVFFVNSRSFMQAELKFIESNRTRVGPKTFCMATWSQIPWQIKLVIQFFLTEIFSAFPTATSSTSKSDKVVFGGNFRGW